MMKHVLIIIPIICSFIFCAGQDSSLVKGRIVFERRVNQWKLIDEIPNKESREELKTYFPNFIQDIFCLTFDMNNSSFSLLKAEQQTKYFNNSIPDMSDITFKQLNLNKVDIVKRYQGTVYNIIDTTRVLQWKILDERRDIAGYNCRKAITVICDSVYVVAFYTDEIEVSNGPESFGGLPGMILGLAVPRLFTTWFATRVEFADVLVEKPKLISGAQNCTWQILIDRFTDQVRRGSATTKRVFWKCML